MANVLETNTMFKNQMNMNRQQRKWINKLKSDEIQIIERYTTDKANKIANEYIFSELANFRIAILAAIYLKFGDTVTTNDLQEILMMANELSYRDDYLRNLGADWMKKIDEARELMKEEMKKLWENENIKTQNKMLHAIKMDSRFSQIGNKDIVVVFKEFKDEMSGIKIKGLEEKKSEVSKALDYIFKEEIDNIKVQKLENEQKKVITIDSVQELKMNNEGEKKMRKSEELKKEFVGLAEEKEKIEKEKELLEKELKKLSEEHSKVHVKEDKLGQAIEILESIGM
ncbi:hypothetical protein [uncultured Clostridium sp.]|uniref:hypothetical protein n=1 Tax=uncultured Clostridium sp. TaxID=59620 RepID=UPI002618F71E|nr:hypothetical protein [uncultured Clostridium sp.]